MSAGLSHITFVVSDLDRMQEILETVLEARCVYDSGAETFSVSEERFFLVGETWIATMKGDPLATRSYNHVAFRVDEADLDDRAARIARLGLEMRPPRPRVQGEGRSVYFYGPDNHLFELHTGTLQERLARYAEGVVAP
jgi:catechol 2,3-dioxygenase-like lactoylglutathione lyase family enzyme